MKLIYCELCGTLESLKMAAEVACKCGNIGGIYDGNGIYAHIYLKDLDSLHNSKVIGINNSLLMGLEKKAICHVGEWNDNQLFIYIDRIRQRYDEIVFPQYESEDLKDAVNMMLTEIGKTPKDIVFIDRVNMFFNRIKGVTDRIRFKDGGYILFAEQPDVKNFICIYVRKKDTYLLETKLVPYDMKL